MPRSCLAFIVLVLLPLLGSGGCRVSQGALTPLDAGQLKARVALASSLPEGDPIGHAQAIAEAEWALQRPGRAARAMVLALRRAESAEWMARLEDDADAIRAAGKARAKIAREARRWAKRVDDPELMARAVLASAHPRRHRRAFQRAVARLPRPPGDVDAARVLELVGNDAASRRQIARWLEDDLEERERMGLLEDPGTGASGLDLRVGALEHALGLRRSPAELRPYVIAVLEADPWHLGARLLALGMAEVEAGVLEDDPLLLDDLYTHSSSHSVSFDNEGEIARLHLRRLESKSSQAVGLALAWRLLRGELIGDVHGVLVSLPVSGVESEAASIGAQLVAMTAARRGDVAAYEYWRTTTDVRSPWLDMWLLRFDDEGYDARLRDAAGRARVRWARWGLPYPATDLRWAVLLEEHVREVDRRWAFDTLPDGRGESRAWQTLCRERSLGGSACVELARDHGLVTRVITAGRTGHFHPLFLSSPRRLEAREASSLAPTLAHYQQTVLAASPEYQRAQLRVALGEGEYERARAVLDAHGDLLPALERTWAWLVIDDVAAGTFTYDESFRALPEFDEHTEPMPETIVEPAPRQLDRYVGGMLLAQRGAHAAALERLMPILDAVPDAAMIDGLAQAALAAHRSGDAELRDALRIRLHAASPHGSNYARLQAEISAGAGRIEEARRFVAHALHWNPEDDTLYRLMVALIAQEPVVSEDIALAYIAHGAPATAGDYQRIRRQIRRGELRSLAAVDQLRVGVDGSHEEAWEVAVPMLQHSPELGDKALQWGLKGLWEAPTFAEALHWGGATLERLEELPPRTVFDRHQYMWLAFLLGRVEAGLAMARLDQSDVGLSPYDEDNDLVQLLRARQAGEIDDALAWDLWRWEWGIDDAASERVWALLAAPPRGTILQEFACSQLIEDDDDLGVAFEVCAHAWEDHPDSLSVAASESYLALAPREPGMVGPNAAEVFARSTIVPRFEDEPGLARRGSPAQAWHRNHAVWLGDQGEHETAAMAWWQAGAFGMSPPELHDGYAQLLWRGSQVRLLQDLDDELTWRSIDIRRSILALAQGAPAVARGYAESARARVPAESGTLDRSQLMFPDRLRHLADWVEDDLREGQLDAIAVAEAIDLVFDPELPRAQELVRAYPHSSIATLVSLLAYREIDDVPPMRPLAEALLERYPGDPLAVATVMPLLVAVGEDERARALYEQCQASYPGDAMLRYIDAPESITGPRDGVPAWVRDPARFDARIALVTDAEVEGLVPQRHASEERAAEVFVPRTWTEVPGRALRFTDGHGARMLVLTSPRASRCQGVDCARSLLEGLAGEGRTKQWMRQSPLAGLEATQALFTNAEEVLLAWVLPSGGRVLTVVVAAPVEQFDALRPAMVMMRDGVRPLDAVLPSFPAESLRAAGPTLRDRWRLRGRREQSRHRGEACSVPETLAGLPHDHQGAELLVDLWLATPDADARRALLRCTEPQRPTARRLALVALLDEHPRAHAFGRRAVSRHASRVMSDVRTILSNPLTPPVAAPDYLRRTDLPGHGLVEVLGALPLEHAGALVERLLASHDPRDRSLAWAGIRLRPELVTDAAIERGLADDPHLVTNVAFLLSDRGEPADAQRLRAHFDALPLATDRSAQTALRSVTVGLASVLDPQDESRLKGAGAKVGDGDDAERAKRLRTALEAVARDHERARALEADPTLASDDDDDDRALRWRDEKQRRTRPLRTEAELRGKTLAQALPGRDWTFARLAAPGLFSSTVADVAGRLTSGDEAIDQRLGDLTSRVLREGGFAALSDSGGLDTSRPIECAKPHDDIGWLCTAQVTDRDALLAVLGQRASGDDAGVSLPISVATTAGFVPVALSVLPAILHPLVYPDEDEDEDEDEDSKTVQIATERAREEIERGGMTLQRYSIIDANTRRLGIDSERYLFLGDRLWVFSTSGTMERVMRVHEDPPLAEDPEFRRLTADWQDGAALQALSLGRAWSLGEGGASMEVVLDESGLHFRYAGAFESEEGVRDIGPALAQLPDGAITTFAHGLGGAPAFDEALKAKGSDATRVPPMPVLAHARGLAFGWYLGDGDRLWRRWLGVAPLDDDLRKRLRRAKTPPGRDRSRRHGSLCYRERDGFLLVGDCELVDRSAAGPPAPPASRDQLRVAHGTFDGRIAADRLPALGGLDLEKKAIVRAVAPMLGVFTEMRVRADWIPAERTAVLEGHVGLRLRPPGDRTRVIDDWLAASEGHNAATLPRRLRQGEIESPLRYRLEVRDAQAFVRDTLADSPRTEATVEDDTHVVLTVSPVPAKPPPVPLSADERKDATERTAVFRIDDPGIVKVAESLAPEGTSAKVAAEAIGQWVHERITYEVTPRSLDGAAILEAGRGDCTEYATLMVTLLRAAGVPAQMRDGMAASGDELVAHAWVAYHDGERWREIDPTWGRSTASAGHLEMSVLDALALISLGKLKVVEISGVP